MIKLESSSFCIAFLFISVYGKVLELDERFLTVEKQGVWLVMFYAPWCGHCKQLEPTWLEVGATLHQQNSGVHVARIDATRYSSMASHFQVRGFPTIVFFKQGVRIDYHGARSKQSIISFVNRAKGPAVTLLDSQDSFLYAKQSHDVFFLYVGDETPLKKMYFNVAPRVFTSLNLYSASKNILPSDVTVDREATILVFKDGKYYEAPSDFLSDSILRMWLLSEQFPSYNRLTGSSFQLLRASGRRYAVSVTKKNDLLNNTLHKIALRRNLPYTFFWEEGNTVINSITYGTITIPNVVVFDARSHEYFVLNEGEPNLTIKKSRVEKFFEDIKAGNVTPKGGNGMVEQIKRLVGDIAGFCVGLFTKQPIVAALIVIVPIVLISCCCFCLCSINDDEIPSSDDEDSEFEDDSTEAIENMKSEDSESQDGREETEAPVEGLRQRVKEGTKPDEN